VNKGQITFIVGLPGSGKTTLGKKLEKTSGSIRFCPDDWMRQCGIGLRDARVRSGVERLQWDLAMELADKGVDSIIERGLWSRAERDYYRAEAQMAGIEAHVVALHVALPILLQRVKRRNRTADSEEQLTEKELAENFQRFQAVEEDESALFDSSRIVTIDS
jgi:predicted kinase